MYEGTRGPGKTDALLMDFARDIGRGLGVDWRGVLFRRTYLELGDVIEKSKKWFPRIFAGAQYNETEHFWRFRDGEALLLRQFERDSDYDKYHGHAYPWIGWEELCNWPNDVPFTSMISTNRSANPHVRKRIRATANPYGVGHNWVKLRFRLPIPPGRIVGPVIADALDREGKPTHHRVVVHGDLSENKILLFADPNYEQTIGAAAKNESQLKAWKRGDWDVVAGGMFDDVWR
ncbi:MAG TPA: terminase, partial [Candidatus Krumholzibacteria bacterium]|nr:terminase [Candidatus Krumholzibacteria bacterium]